MLFLAPKLIFPRVDQFWKPPIFSKGPLPKPHIFKTLRGTYIPLSYLRTPPPSPAPTGFKLVNMNDVRQMAGLMVNMITISNFAALF